MGPVLQGFKYQVPPDGFGKKVIHSSTKAFLFKFIHYIGGKRQDGYPGSGVEFKFMGSNLPGGFDPIHFRHIDVH